MSPYDQFLMNSIENLNHLTPLLPVRAYYRRQEEMRIADLHQQADSEDWNGQVFRRPYGEDE